MNFLSDFVCELFLKGVELLVYLNLKSSNVNQFGSEAEYTRFSCVSLLLVFCFPVVPWRIVDRVERMEGPEEYSLEDCMTGEYSKEANI